MLKKEIREDLNKWRGIECLYIGRLDIMKILILPKLTYGCSTTPIKIIAGVFVDIYRVILRFVCTGKGVRIAKNNFEKNTTMAGTSLPNFKSYQFSSVAQLCLTLCDLMDCSTPRFPVHHQLLELAQTLVYRVSDARRRLRGQRYGGDRTWRSNSSRRRRAVPPNRCRLRK